MSLSWACEVCRQPAGSPCRNICNPSLPVLNVDGNEHYARVAPPGSSKAVSGTDTAPRPKTRQRSTGAAVRGRVIVEEPNP